MSEAKLDQIVKGAPAPNTSLPAVTSAVASNPPTPALAAAIHESQRPVARTTPSDRDSYHHSAPPQIYLNLLILEASLRAQYLALYARRRQHTFFLLLLALWLAYFTWALFLRPREDGKGHGGSVYWVVDMYEKVSWLGGMLTAVLIWATGQWDRGVRWPRRWVGITNRGLRGMNLKIVVLRGPWWRQTVSYLGFVLPHRSFFFNPGTSYRYVPVEADEEKQGNLANGTSATKSTSHRTNRQRSQLPSYREEDIAPGGDHVKLLLLPKNFSAEFRENWEVYRTEYWEKENERRAELRKVVRKREREEARGQGGLLWWTGWRGWRKAVGLDQHGGRPSDVEKMHHQQQNIHHNNSRTGRDTITKRSRSGAESHSRSSSRSSTASGTPELAHTQKNKNPNSSSTSTTTSTSTRHARSSSSSSSVSASSQPRKSPSTAIDSPDSSELSDAATAGNVKLRRRGGGGSGGDGGSGEVGEAVGGKRLSKGGEIKWSESRGEGRRESRGEGRRESIGGEGRVGESRGEGGGGQNKDEEVAVAAAKGEEMKTRRVSVTEELQLGMGMGMGVGVGVGRARQRDLSFRAEEG